MAQVLTSEKGRVMSSREQAHSRAAAYSGFCSVETKLSTVLSSNGLLTTKLTCAYVRNPRA